LDWAFFRGLPVVYHEHQTPDGRLELWEDFCREINKAAQVIAVSHKSAQALRSACGVNRPIRVVNPLFEDPFRQGIQITRARTANHDQITITAIARLDEVKGLEYLLEAVAMVANVYPSLQLKIYGDGPLRQQLLDRSAQLGLDGKKIFAGVFNTRKELAAIMAQTDIFTISSLNEGQPVSLVEAMAYEVPIVATTVGGIPELIVDGVNGLLCAPKDSSCLAQKLCTLIEDQELRMRLGIAARQSFERGQFTPEAITRQLVSIYQQVLRQN
jgi:glycosyltransferase involved in cell wall biosynthesis